MCKLLQAPGERFQEIKSKQKEVNTVVTPFKATDVLDNVQREMTELQSNDGLKVRLNNLPLLQF